MRLFTINSVPLHNEMSVSCGENDGGFFRFYNKRADDMENAVNGLFYCLFRASFLLNLNLTRVSAGGHQFKYFAVGTVNGCGVECAEVNSGS